jgi:hypothetical protein
VRCYYTAEPMATIDSYFDSYLGGFRWYSVDVVDGDFLIVAGEMALYLGSETD